MLWLLMFSISSVCFFFFKQKTAYEFRIIDWSSDVCSSDLGLIQLIPPHERLLTIEDTRELVVPHRNVVHMLYAKDKQGTAKISAKDLLESALRMRPDRILLQELRDGTAFFYLRNVNSGHPGSITTIHAESAELAFEQLTLLVKASEGGAELARDHIRSRTKLEVEVVGKTKKVEGRFRVTEIYFDPENRL